MDTVKIVKEFYDQDANYEWERLSRHISEFEITKRFIDRYIKSGDKVLDVGGGPGRYSLYLAERGCDVTLVDLSPKHVEFAKQKANETGVSIKAFDGDARKIETIVNEKYDHILLMGPLYHLIDEVDRVDTVNACINLLKPNGILYASFISSYGGIIYMMKYDPALLASNEEELEFMNLFIQDKPFSGKAFTQAYLCKHKDVLPFMSQFPLEKLHFFGQEGILAPCEPNILAQSEEVIEKWITLSEKVCEREDLLSYSEHLMYIGRKL